MRTVAAVFTAQSIVESTKQLFAELVPDCRVISIIEDAMIQDVIRAGRVTPETPADQYTWRRKTPGPTSSSTPAPRSGMSPSWRGIWSRFPS
jgi:hypothetical protein